MSTFDQLTTFAHTLCDEAAVITQRHFRRPLTIDHKSDASPVTIADRDCEAHLRERIRTRYPDHAILGEEFGASGDSEWQWIIDPIDGTRSFISGFPTYATLIALLHHQQPVLNIINMPALGERFTATTEQTSQFNGQPIHTSTTTELAQARLQSTDPHMFTPEQWARRQQLIPHVALERFNGDGYLYAMLAAGWIDLVVEADLKAHDFLPVMLLVQQAGGIISDWSGQALTPQSNGEILAAATPALHQAALAKLAHKQVDLNQAPSPAD